MDNDTLKLLVGAFLVGAMLQGVWDRLLFHWNKPPFRLRHRDGSNA